MINTQTAKRINVLCFPFAGGNRYSYRALEEKSSDLIKLIPQEYPGRGARAREPLLTDIQLIVEDLYAKIVGLTENEDFAMYGHSMGGLIAFLLTRKMVNNNRRHPLHVFVTGTSGPSAPDRIGNTRHLLSKEDFIKEIRNLNGSPTEILQNKELLEYFEPILRADFTANEMYVHQPSPPLDLPFTVITGDQEDMTSNDIYAWQKETNRTIEFTQMAGDHFFIFQHAEKIVKIIHQKLVLNTVERLAESVK